MKILFLTPRFPYPPLKGDQVIPFYRLKYLSQRHSISLLTFYQNAKELEYLREVDCFCENVKYVKLTKFQSVLNVIFGGMTSGLPFQILYYKSSEFRKALGKMIAGEKYDIIHTYMLRLAEYSKNITGHKIIDFIDSMQLNLRRRTLIEKYPNKLAFLEELRRIAGYENVVTKYYDYGIVVSDNDRNQIKAENIVSIPLGIDTDRFKPGPFLSNNKTIIFSGNMGYFPNENSALWFISHVFDDINREIPNVRFVIAGNSPSKKLRNLHDGRRIIVTGFVESIVDELQKAQLAVAPMQAGSGMQFKVLEAMSCGLPVVATSMGVGTISAMNNVNIMIEDDPELFAHACINLLKDYRLSKNIGDHARQLILDKYSWESHVDKVEVLYKSVMKENVKEK
jgi:sugar transferase (PEP-CTERM/EpsH1 system associated)